MPVAIGDTGLVIRKETLKGRVLQWYGEPFGRIYRDPAWDGKGKPVWLGEYWDGKAKGHVWQGRNNIYEAATACLGDWAKATKTDLLEARKAR